MAKSSTPRAGPSRIRFIMVEADLYDGDLEHVTQVLQNAFRNPQVSTGRPPIARVTSRKSVGSSEQPDADEELDQGEDEFVEEIVVEKQRSPRKPRPAKVPTVLNDIDVKSAPALKDFISEFELKSNVDRYLVVALWFRDARAINSITVDHVYTCFRLLSWPTSSTDFSKPLKNLRDEQSMTGGAKGYSLTLTGAGKIEAKKRPQNDV